MFSRSESGSPLMQQINAQDPLTLKNLAYYIPRMREGRVAKAELDMDTEGTSTQDRQVLWNSYQEGEKSKEILVLKALPLINTIARNEYNRRASWNSRISLEEMIQEGIGGFLRGLDAYNIDGKQVSPTNYLGQWISSDIRRHVETLDHDFTIPHETAERHRKIRAIRSALTNELGRSPHDEEIIERANSDEHKPKTKMGKLDKSSYKGRLLTQKHVNEERAYASSTGNVSSLTVEDETSQSEYEKPATPLEENEQANSLNIEERSAKEALTRFLEDVFQRMKLGETQEKVIRQKFGLHPYFAEVPAIGIANNVHLSKYRVNQIITAFVTEMSSKGSVFHQAVSLLSFDELDSVGMSWVINSLGEYPKGSPQAVNSVLTQTIKATPKTARKNFGEQNRVMTYNYRAFYQCAEGHVSDIGLIASNNKLRALSACNTCGLPVTFLRIEPFQSA